MCNEVYDGVFSSSFFSFNKRRMLSNRSRKAKDGTKQRSQIGTHRADFKCPLRQQSVSPRGWMAT